MPFGTLLLTVLLPLATDASSPGPCQPIPLYEGGVVTTTVCAGAAGPGVVVVDLTDGWTPRLFSEQAGDRQPYRSTFVALANERLEGGREWDTARSDRYYELFGIFPSPSVIRARLLEEERHTCHDRIDDGSLVAGGSTSSRQDPRSDSRSRALAVADTLHAAQEHLRCEGMLPARARDGALDTATQGALTLYQRKHMVPSRGALDADTRATLATNSRELDFLTLLRALRERVADAAGLIEDGSARNAWEPVLGRFLEPAEYRTALRSTPIDNGAPDLISRATEAAAVALGWTSPQAAVQTLSGALPAAVAVRLPEPPRSARQLRLRVEVDRGDVWSEYPLSPSGVRRPSPVRRRPTLTLFAVDDRGETALVRWPTTIGSWQDEQSAGDRVALRYKPSPVGRRYWRDLLAGPAWFPPPTTPDRELVRRRPDGSWTANQDAVGPGYRSAYGLIALLHHRAVGGGGDPAGLIDAEIRTHGSGNYRSIMRGSSHGCHRLFNHLAIRLGSFLLGHVEHRRHGAVDARYWRSIRWSGRALALHAETRGYRFELIAPIPVDVLAGHPVRSRPVRPPPGPLRPAPPPPQSASASRTPPPL